MCCRNQAPHQQETRALYMQPVRRWWSPLDRKGKATQPPENRACGASTYPARMKDPFSGRISAQNERTAETAGRHVGRGAAISPDEVFVALSYQAGKLTVINRRTPATTWWLRAEPGSSGQRDSAVMPLRHRLRACPSKLCCSSLTLVARVCLLFPCRRWVCTVSKNTLVGCPLR